MTSTLTNRNEVFAAPRPTTNKIQETLRWLPNGVRQTLLSVDGSTPLDHLPTVTLKYLHDQGLTRTPTKGNLKGHTILSENGRKVRRALTARMEGKDGS